MKRKIETTVNAVETMDGDGVKIFRSIGSHFLPQLDPFLLLDELKSDNSADYIGGFPPHPHRGFETVTYMLEGQMRHKDSVGNEGVIAAGDIQWMTAGSGIIHSEMPEQHEGKLWGFQLWTNLSAAEKMRSPRYQEFAANTVPELIDNGSNVRVLTGEMEGITGPVTAIATKPLLLDLTLQANAKKRFRVPFEHAAIVYVYSGSIFIEGKKLTTQQLGQLSQGDEVEIHTENGNAGVLFLAAAPLNEPIVKSGPFVMNTEAELQQAFSDYRKGTFIRQENSVAES
jgi:redox-sensitive bicupin YhaK (pirin superfamily)